MSYSVDRTTNLITIPQSDLTFLSGSNYSLDATKVHKELRRIEWDFYEGAIYPQMLKYHDPVVMAGVPYPAKVEIINGYTIQFSGSNYNVIVSGPDTNIFDVYVPSNGISVLALNSIGKQEVQSIETERLLTISQFLALK